MFQERIVIQEVRKQGSSETTRYFVVVAKDIEQTTSESKGSQSRKPLRIIIHLLFE